MKISSYKNQQSVDWLKGWTQKILDRSVLAFTTNFIETSYGKTCVYAYQAHRTDLPAIIVMPGMRTSAMYWLINNNLTPFAHTHRVYLVDNIGQPGLSAGNNPNIKGSDYGKWMLALTQQLHIDKAYWLGASFGCQLIVKLSQVAPEKIIKACFICPGGIVQIGMTWKNLSANMFIMWFKTQGMAARFMNKVVYGPGLTLSGTEHDLLSEGILETVKRFDMQTGYPYPMKAHEFKNMTMPVLILPGGNDPMFAPERLQPRIKNVFPVQPAFEALPGHGHGSELSPLAIEKAAAFFNA